MPAGQPLFLVHGLNVCYDVTISIFLVIFAFAAGPCVSPSPSAQERREQGAALHRRLLDGDPLASAELALLYLEPLAKWLQQHNKSSDIHLCSEAAGDAILALIRDPASYQPTKSNTDSGLEGYLRMSAKGDLLNREQKEKKHRENRIPWKVVELDGEAGKYIGGSGADSVTAENDDRKAKREAILARELERMSETERKVFELMQRGERATPAFAEVLGIQNQPADEQEAEVYRVKDRVIRRLKRAGKKL